jgi:CheY-like chemotaxis protein
MPKQILLVEDSVTIQRVVQIAFAREDYQISSTTGADEALARMKESRPDVVVVDAGLIGKSGYDLATAIKADPATKDVPVLLLTNNFTPYDEARGKVAGVDAFLAKPFDTQSIIDRVGALAKGKAAGATAAPAVAAAAPVSAPTPAAAATPRVTPVAVAAAPAVPARPPASVPPPSASTPQGLGVIGRPTPAPVAMPPAPAAAAAPIEPPRATLMGMPTVQAMGTPNLRPPTPTPVAVKVRDIPATLTPAAPISAPAPVAATPVVVRCSTCCSCYSPRTDYRRGESYA